MDKAEWFEMSRDVWNGGPCWCSGKRPNCITCGGSGQKAPCRIEECQEHGCCGYGNCMIPKPPEPPRSLSVRELISLAFASLSTAIKQEAR